jgi:hypothetical protein
MSQPLQAESPVLVRSIEDGEVDLVGRVHYVALVRNRPRTLGTWRVTTESPRIGDRIAQLLGGHVQEDRTGDRVEILTTSSTIDIVLTGPNALHIDWRRDETNICQGANQDDREFCICPADFQLRRAAAKQGSGCWPLAEVRFRLLDDQTAGVLGFVSNDWSFVDLICTTQEILGSRKDRSPVIAQLGLRRSLHTLRSGTVLPYTRPVITLLATTVSSSSVSDVISE